MKLNVIMLLMSILLLAGCSQGIDHKKSDYQSLVNYATGNTDSEGYKFPDPELIIKEGSVSYKFEEIRIGEDLYVKRTVELKETGEGAITLDFSGEGQGEHIEVIPKSFAASASDIDFSEEPDEIINNDPVVRWNLDSAGEKIKLVTAKITVAAYKKGVQVGEIEGAKTYAKLLASGDFDFFDFSSLEKKAKKAGLEAGKKAGLNEAQEQLIDYLDDFLFVADIQVCVDKTDIDDRRMCLLTLISKRPDWFDCEEVFSNYKNKDMGHAITTCKAIQEDNPKICEKAAYNDVEIGDDGMMTDYEAACEKQFLIIKINQCNGKLRDDYEKCIIEAVSDTGQKDVCDDLLGGAADRCRAVADGKPYEDEAQDNSGTDSAEPANKRNCMEMDDGFYRNACIKSEAKKYCDIGLCAVFERDYDVNLCIEDVARECGIDYCLSMVDSKTAYNRVSCIWKLAKTKKDCELMEDEEHSDIIDGTKNKENCLKRTDIE
ncbi:hypothetical protein JXB31_04765 [Candidatus Woesearchaeota archaeon]|nr:hypothetical protein [Candidatus Woesearchaeota archaeon]